jgi:hypothetical protein
MTKDDLMGALAELNRAAYAAIRVGKDTTAFPNLNRERLRYIARLTDEMFEDPNKTSTCSTDTVNQKGQNDD